MSYRERANRKAEAAAASARFAELEALIRERAALRVLAPRMLADLPERYGLDAVDVLRLEEIIAEELAGLSARIGEFKGDPRVMTLAEAALAVGWPG